MNHKLNAGRAREAFHYDSATGEFTRLIRTANRTRVGQVVNSKNNHGYIVLRIDGRQYVAHRVAWLYVTGEWPRYEIDHADMDRSNNRWSNLREATKSQNAANAHHRNPKSGLKGAYWRKEIRKYAAKIWEGDKLRHLGVFNTAEEAHAAYCAAAKAKYGEFARAA